MNLQNIKAKFQNKNSNNKLDFSKTNILYEAENKDNSVNSNNNKSMINRNNKESIGGENSGNKINNKESENEEDNQLRKLILVQLAFKRFLALMQRKKLREEKVKIIDFFLVFSIFNF